MKPFFVYMLQCADGSYYVGHTDELELRVAKHQAGEVPGYTQKRRPVRLVWSQETVTRDEALAAEMRIKGWGRGKKEALIRDDWEAIQRHAWGTKNPLPEHLREGASIPQPERGVGDASAAPTSPSVRPEVSKGQASGTRPSMSRPDPSTPQDERVRASILQPDPSIPQDERVQASTPQPERLGEGANLRAINPVRPEVSKGRANGKQASIPQPEGGVGDASAAPNPPSVRPEVSKGRVDGNEASIPQPDPSIPQDERVPASIPQPERAGDRADPTSPKSVRPEVSKGHAPSHHGSLADSILHAAAPQRRRAIAKSITLLESTRSDHRAQADELLTALVPHTGNSLRLGISGVPGVGKSTFIEALGLMLIAQGHRVAVLAIDPSSTVSGGSILGDKTRMEQLSINEHAYIRPSPSSGTLGGVAEKTRESMLVLEAAGYDIVIVETVGVGQSETAVAGMTDMFVLMQLPNAGDDLQAIKKGVMELADLVAINKADLDSDAARRARAQISSAMRLFGQHGNPAHAAHDDTLWQPQVLELSALKAQGLGDFWQAVTRFQTLQNDSGRFAKRRQHQNRAWMWERIEAGLKARFRADPQVKDALAATSAEVEAGTLAASVAARRLLDLMD